MFSLHFYYSYSWTQSIKHFKKITGGMFQNVRVQFHARRLTCEESQWIIISSFHSSSSWLIMFDQFTLTWCQVTELYFINSRIVNVKINNVKESIIIDGNQYNAIVYRKILIKRHRFVHNDNLFILLNIWNSIIGASLVYHTVHFT